MGLVGFVVNGALLGAMVAQIAALRSGLPVYIAVGESDPVDGGLTLLTPVLAGQG